MKKSPFSLSTTISTFYSRKNLKHHSIGFGQRNKKTKPEKKEKSKFKLQLLKKKYYGWGKSSLKPPSSNQFLLFSVIWKEATTHSLFEVLDCVELCCVQQHFVWTASVYDFNNCQTFSPSARGEVPESWIREGMEQHFILGGILISGQKPIRVKSLWYSTLVRRYISARASHHCVLSHSSWQAVILVASDTFPYTKT